MFTGKNRILASISQRTRFNELLLRLLWQSGEAGMRVSGDYNQLGNMASIDDPRIAQIRLLQRSIIQGHRRALKNIMEKLASRLAYDVRWGGRKAVILRRGYSSIVTGSSMKPLKAESNCAPSAPSTTR